MYLRPDEVARVLEKVGFTVDVVTQKAYGYRRGKIMSMLIAKRNGTYRSGNSSNIKRTQFDTG